MGVDFVWHHTGIRLERLGVGEEAGFAEVLRKLCLPVAGFVGFQPVNAAVVIHHIKLPVAIGAKANDPQSRVHQLLVPGDLSVVTESPNFAGDIIAVHILAGEQRVPLAVVHVTAGNAQRLGVRMLHSRCEDGRGAALAVGIDGLAAFHNAPAVVAAALHLVNHFHAFPADIAHPQVALGAIKTHPPRIAHAVGPHLAARAGCFHKWIIRRDPIRAALVAGIHVNAQNAAEQIADVLTGLQAVGWAGRSGVASGNI